MVITQLNSQMNIRHRFDVIADPDGGYVIEFPELPGCMTQIDSFDEIGPATQEIYELWINAARDNGTPIPTPADSDSYSGKFLLRLPKSLHRRLAERARIENVSLNQLVQSLLAEGLGRITTTDQLARHDSRYVAETSASYPANPTDLEK